MGYKAEMTDDPEIISARVAPAFLEMIPCEIELSGVTRLKPICGDGSRKTVTSTTMI